MSTAYPRQAEETFVELVNLLGMSATTTSESRERGIYLKVDTPEPGRLIGRKGQTLHSIQYLLNVMVQRRDSDFPRVFIDIADDARGKPRKSNGSSDGERSERGGERRERSDRRDGDRRRRDDNQRDDRGPARERQQEAAPEKPAAEAAPAVAPEVEEVASVAPAAVVESPVAATPSVEIVVEPAVAAPATPASEGSSDDWRPSDPAPACQPRREQRSERSERPERRRGDLSPEDKARKQTADAIKEVRRWGEAVKLPPLTVEMRKVVLEVLADHSDVVMEGELDEHVDRKRVTLMAKEG